MTRMFNISEKVVANFLEQYQAYHTKYAYQNNIKKLDRFLHLENLRLETLTPIHLRRFLIAFLQHYSPAYVENIRASMYSFFRFLVDANIIEKDISETLRAVRIPRVIHKKRGLSNEDRDKLTDSLKYKTLKDLRTSCIVLFGLHAGLRVSEIAKLKWADVDFVFSDLAAPFGVFKIVQGKGMKDRMMAMSQKLNEVLNEYRRAYVPEYGLFPSPYLFPSRWREDQPLTCSAIQTILKTQAKIAGLDRYISVHEMRYTFATRLDESGATILEIRDLLGHSWASTTERYINVSQKRAFTALKKALN